MDITKEQIVAIFQSENFKVSKIESYEEGIKSKEEVIGVLKNITDITVNLGEKGQDAVLSCKCDDRDIYIQIENGTNDEEFLISYFDGEVYGYDKLIEMTEKERLFISGIIDQNNSRREFYAASELVKDDSSVFVNCESYPYRIYQSKFKYCRVDRNRDTFAACDECMYVYLNSGEHVKLFYSDYDK